LIEDNLIKKLTTLIKCSAYGRHYEVDNVKVLGHEEDLWFLSAFCPECSIRCFIVAAVREGKNVNTTDLTDAELNKFSKMDKLTADDILDMHNFLKDFEGDFSRLFD
jgi:hypothetical protein